MSAKLTLIIACVSIISIAAIGSIVAGFLVPAIVTTTTSTSTTTTVKTITTTAATTTTTTTTVLYSFMSLFANKTNSNLFSNVNPTIASCRNVAVATINNVLYNIVHEPTVGAYLYNTNWVYVRTFNLPSTFYVISVNNYFYFTTITGNTYPYGIIKTTVSSTALVNYYASNYGRYRSLYYDSVNLRIIAAGCDVNLVDILDLNLNLQTTLYFTGACPHGITMSNNKIYISFWTNGNIVELTNNAITNTFTSPCSNYIAAINIDSSGYFAFTCYGTGYSYLYDPNFQYTNMNILTPNTNNFDIRLDTNNRLAICTQNNVYVYY